MPLILPSQRTFMLQTAFIDPGEKWFSAPTNHLWYWKLDEDLSPPPLNLGEEAMSMPVAIPVPKSHTEAKNYIRVLELMPDGNYGWRGEWLIDFPEYTDLSEEDLAVWDEWIGSDTIHRFLNSVIERSQRLAEASVGAHGYVMMQGS